jgi:hypothetical protein
LGEWLRNLHVLFALLTLLGVYFILLGISLAGLVSALRKKEQLESDHGSTSCPREDESI